MNKLTAAILIIMLAMTGCGKAKPDVPNQTETTEATTAEANEVTTEALTPVYGGTLKMSMRKPHTLNPLLNEDVTVDRALKLIFEPLFVLDEKQQVTPNLADGYLLSGDGKSVAISIKNDAKWSDGTPVTADDLIFSLDTIKSASAASVYKSALTNVSGYHKESSSTVVVEYSAPYGGCIYNLCFPLIPKHYYDGNNTTSSPKSLKPLGNGLYTFESYRVVRDMTLKAGENFRGKPYIENVKVTVMSDKQTEIDAFEQGLIDVLEVTPEEYGMFNSKNKFNVTPFSSNRFEFLGFNFNNSALSNKSIRQAIACAVPMDNIIDNIYLGNAVKSITPVNPQSVLYSEEDLPTYSYDLNRARALVAQTGLSTGQLTFTILVNQENSERCEIAELMASELNQIGMQVTVYRTPFDNYVKLLQNHSYSMFIGGTELTARADLRSLLASYSRDSGINYFNYADTQMDNMLLSCTNATSESGYKTALGTLQKYCASQLPLVGLGFKSGLLLTDADVQGTKIPVTNNIYANENNWFIEETETTSTNESEAEQ